MKLTELAKAFDRALDYNTALLEELDRLRTCIKEAESRMEDSVTVLMGANKALADAMEHDMPRQTLIYGRRAYTVCAPGHIAVGLLPANVSVKVSNKR